MNLCHFLVSSLEPMLRIWWATVSQFLPSSCGLCFLGSLAWWDLSCPCWLQGLGWKKNQMSYNLKCAFQMLIYPVGG